MLRHSFLWVPLCVMVLGLTVATITPAHALKLTLKRAVFEGNRRAEVITIINNGSEEETYRLGWRALRMTEEAALVPLAADETTAGLMPADQLVRFAPRRIVVPPGGAQQVRLMLTKPADLAPGEYRSHLWLQPEAESVKFPAPTKGEGQPAVQLKMLTGMTIPVIVRHGETTVKATMSAGRAQAHADKKGAHISFTIGRQGNRSLYGDIKFLCGDVLAREIKGIALYTEITQRHLAFDIKYPDGNASACPVIHVQYIADAEDQSLKGALLAATEIAVP